MSDNQNFGFGKFVPGFDFLQNLAKGASQTLPQMPNLSNWVAPTLNLEELEKRIGELKAVHFWLDQNSKALGATIQALEVQKMTLSTLKTMNVQMEGLRDSMQIRMPTITPPAPAAAKAPEPEPAPEPAAAADEESTREAAAPAPAPTPGVVDPMQWWGALTKQFTELATTAMKDTASDAARKMAGASLGASLTPGAGAAAPVKRGPAAKKAAAKKAPAKKAAPRR